MHDRAVASCAMSGQVGLTRLYLLAVCCRALFGVACCFSTRVDAAAGMLLHRPILEC
jgi:hypothetical protein